MPSVIRQTAILASLACATFAAPSRVCAGIHFEELSAEAGVSTRHDNLGLFLDGRESQNFYGSGVAFEDVNLDGWPDLILASGETGRSVYLNEHDGTFSDASAWFGNRPRSTSTGVVLADVDNNGRPDLLMTNYYGEPWFFVGSGASLNEQAVLKGLSPLMFDAGQEPVDYAGPQSMGAAFGDWNADGFVDLYVANYQPDRRDMFLRGIDGSYFRRTTRVDVPAAVAGFQPVFVDLDDDGDLDVYVANDFAMNFYFENQGAANNWAFVEKAAQYKISGNANWPSDHVMSMGVTIGDYDNDLDLDIYVCNYYKNALYTNPGGPGPNVKFQEMGGVKGIQHDNNNSWGTSFLDADNDGDLDLCVTAGWIHSNAALDQGRELDDRFFENLGAPDYHFANVTDEANFHDLQAGRGLAVGDYDRDGRLDIAVWNCSLHDPDNIGEFTFYPGDLRLYHNESTDTGHWLALRLVGSGAPRCNASGIGARIYVTAEGTTQMREIRAGESFMSHNTLEAEFGLGDATTIDEVRVRWTDGTVETFEGVQLDAIQALVEGSGVASKYGDFLSSAETHFDGRAVSVSWRMAPWVQPSSWTIERADASIEPLEFVELNSAGVQFEANVGRFEDSQWQAGREAIYRVRVGSHGNAFVESILTPSKVIESELLPPEMEPAQRSRVGNEVELPSRPTLLANAPNPFNPHTQLRFVLPEAQRVTLELYDLKGRRLRVLAEGEFPRGESSLSFDGRDRDGNLLASGVYIYALRTQSGTVARRLTLLR